MEVAALTPACSKRRFVEADVADRTFFSQLGVSGGLSGFSLTLPLKGLEVSLELD